MQDSQIKIFFSWQSDLPANETRSVIQAGIEKAVKLLRDTVKIEADRDTQGESGSPDIAQTIFSKIDDCDIFIADVSPVCGYNPFNSGDDMKLSPNPNVLIELGYAARVIGWENIICITNLKYGTPQRMPFDIAHHRMTTYSLDNEEKSVVKKRISGIIQETVEKILENGKRVRESYSNIKVGSYNFEEKEISKTIIPWNLNESSVFLSLKNETLERCYSLIENIESISLPFQESSLTEDNENDLSGCDDKNTIVISDGEIVSPSKLKYEFMNFKRYKAKIHEEDSEDIISLVEIYLHQDIPDWEKFFFVGNLEMTYPYGIGNSYELNGTEQEKDKYEKIQELHGLLCRLRMMDYYLETFDGLLFLPFAIKNDSKVADQDISINIKINPEQAEIVLPTGNLINSELEGLEGKIYELDMLKTLLMMPESGEIQYDRDISMEAKYISIPNQGLSIPGVNGVPKYDKDDYVYELSKYIEEPLAGSSAEYVYNIELLRPKEIKWLGGAILLRPMSNHIEISYSVKSNNSDGSLSGTLVYEMEGN